MYLIKLIIFVGLITESFSIYATTPVQTYFPPEVVKAIIKKSGTDILLSMYADQLLSMNEPSIYQQCNSNSSEIYRFLYIPSFDKTFAITVKRIDNGAILNFHVQGNKGIDKIFNTGQKNVPINDWNQLKKSLDKVAFFNAPSMLNKLGSDGEHWVFEGCRSGAYHLIDRWSPEPKEDGELIIQLGEEFVCLADLDLAIRPVVIDAKNDASR